MSLLGQYVQTVIGTSKKGGQRGRGNLAACAGSLGFLAAHLPRDPVKDETDEHHSSNAVESAVQYQSKACSAQPSRRFLLRREISRYLSDKV